MIGWKYEGLGYRLKRLTWRRLAQSISGLWFSSPIYRLMLSGGRPERLKFSPDDLWPGVAERGAVIIDGEFKFFGQPVAIAGDVWRQRSAPPKWMAELHSFGWLRDLHAVGGEAPRIRARALILSWIESEGRWRSASWRPDILGARVASWLTHADFLAGGADDAFMARYLDSLGRQVRHLRRALRLAAPGLPRLLVLKAAILASLCLANERKRLARRIAILERELAAQFAADGGHVSRSPSEHFRALKLIVDIRTSLSEARTEIPKALQNAIDRAAPMLRFFRHGDGGLALFNDSNEEEAWMIDVLLTRADARGKPLDTAPHTGYQRLSANRTLILMDSGAPPAPGLDSHAHAGTLSFELSVGKERLVVNCGAYAGDNDDWMIAQRTTAAHSTLTVGNINSSELLPSGAIGNRPKSVLSDRRDTDGNVWIDASHDGYQTLLGLTHSRRLYLAANGGDLRGEDTLSGKGEHKFTVRFHLHPTVSASLVQDGGSVLMRLPSGAGWRFRSSGGVVSMQESVYLGVRGEIKRTEQIVVSGATQNGGAQVKWAFTRMSK